MEQPDMTNSDTLPFFRAWLKAPLRVASVTPSSTALAHLITREIEPGAGPVLELGPGTGAFTAALLRRGVPEHDVTLVELGSVFARLLRDRYPRARMLAIDASNLKHAPEIETHSHAAAISGLPLLSMRHEAVEAILDGVFSALKPGAALYQFTYGYRCPIAPAVMTRLGLGSRRVGFVWANLPPATVFRIEKHPR
jgi:phosphatidylethanolamine/phosphatidyl-N-methylethanolamine N-methyltransferase